MSTTEKVDQPDDVILLLGRPRSKPGKFFSVSQLVEVVANNYLMLNSYLARGNFYRLLITFASDTQKDFHLNCF